MLLLLKGETQLFLPSRLIPGIKRSSRAREAYGATTFETDTKLNQILQVLMTSLFDCFFGFRFGSPISRLVFGPLLKCENGDRQSQSLEKGQHFGRLSSGSRFEHTIQYRTRIDTGGHEEPVSTTQLSDCLYSHRPVSTER